MSTVYLPCDALTGFVRSVFRGYGFSERDAEIIADVLITSDLYGIRSHGIQRMVRYYKGILNGSMQVSARHEVVMETPVSAVIDGKRAMGQLTGYAAMNMAIEKAERTGIGMVTVRNSSHYGIAGYYAKMASDRGLIGFSCTNTAAISVPTHGKRAMLGSNPMAVAVPADPFPFFFDASTTVVARGKIEVYDKLEKPLPGEWAVDSEGRVTSDASEALACTLSREGGMLPLGGAGEENGGYKGYGYGIVCELFSSILSLGETCNHVSIQGGGVSHGFIALSPSLFGDPQAIRDHFSRFLEELRSSPRANGAERIYTHGEKEQLAQADRLQNGIPVDDRTLKEIKEIAEYTNVDFESCFLNPIS